MGRSCRIGLAVRVCLRPSSEIDRVGYLRMYVPVDIFNLAMFSKVTALRSELPDDCTILFPTAFH